VNVDREFLHRTMAGDEWPFRRSHFGTVNGWGGGRGGSRLMLNVRNPPLASADCRPDLGLIFAPRGCESVPDVGSESRFRSLAKQIVAG
jgi:hypothetical protein